MQHNNDFKYDLKVGKLAEKNLSRLLSGKNIEVKLDRWAQLTGNIAVEFSNRGKPSGIETTRADFWCYVVEVKGEQDLMVLIETNKLRKICERYYFLGRTKKMGDNDMSEAVLVPVNEILPTLIKIT
jgi:hypothetical protein